MVHFIDQTNAKFVATLLLSMFVFASEASAAGPSDCRAKDSPYYAEGEALVAAGKIVSDRAEAMLLANEPGWMRVLREGGVKSRDGYALFAKARRAAHLCRMNMHKRENRSLSRSLWEEAKEESKRKFMSTWKSEFPTVSKYTSLGKTQWNLFRDKDNVNATLANVSSSMLQLRALPKQPLNAGWAVSGELLNMALRDYQTIVAAALRALNAKLKEYDQFVYNYHNSLRSSVRKRREVEQSWVSARQPPPQVSDSGGGGDSGAFTSALVQGLAGAAAAYGSYRATRPSGGNRTRTYRAPSRPTRRRVSPSRTTEGWTDAVPAGPVQ